ncbi:hypothetical protein ABPG77_006107 [Micractinium sp. CCAP 211/92]
MAAKSPLKELLCGICHEDLLAQDGAEIGELECPHRFCYPCIAKWAEIENSCPFCKKRFARLRRKRLAPRAALAGLDASAELPGVYLDTQQVEQRNQRVAFEDPQFQQWLETVACLVCGGGDDEDQLLLCDECDRACHTFCAGLQEIPSGEWYCPRCEQRRRGRGRQRGQRRARAEAVELLDSSQESDEEGRRPTQRRRTAAAGSGRRTRSGAAAGGRRRGAAAGGGSRAANDDLSDFVVPDESEVDSDWLEDDAPADQARRSSARGRSGAARDAAAAPRRRGMGAQRSGSGAAHGGRARRQRQVASSKGSDESTHDQFQDSEPEADYTDSEASSDEGAGQEDWEEEDERPLLARLQRRARAQPSNGSRRSGGGRASRARGRAGATAADASTSRPASAAGRKARVDDLDAPTRAHRDVAALAASWDDLRQGSTTFAELRRSASGGSGRAAAEAQPPRRRLVRAGALAGSSSGGRRGAAPGAASSADVVDLLDSPSPGLLRSGRAGRSPAGAAAAADEELAWQAMQAALEEGAGQQRQRGRARQRQVVHSPAGGCGNDDDEDLDVPLAVRLTREIAAARQRGSQFVPRQQQQQQQQAAPPSTGRRTVRDMRLMAAAARGGTATPGSGGLGSAGRAAIRIPRMRGFDDAGAGGRSGGQGSTSSRAPPQPPQQQQEQNRNPFVRFQCNGGSGGDSGRLAGGGHSDGARWDSYPRQAPSHHPARHSSPQPLHRRNSSPQPLHRRNSSPQPLHRRNSSPQPLHRRNSSPQPLHRRDSSPQPMDRGRPAGSGEFSFATQQMPQRAVAPVGAYQQPAPSWQQQQQQQRQEARHSWVQRQNGSTATPGVLIGGAPAGFGFQFAGSGGQQPPPGQQQPGSVRRGSAAHAPADSTAVPWQLQGQQRPAPPVQLAPHPQLLHQQHGAAPTAQQAQQQQAQQQHAQPSQAQQQRQGQLSKQAILDRVKPLLKQRMQEGLLSRDTFKQAAKSSVARLFEAQQAPGWQGLSDGAVEGAVAEAVRHVVDGPPS